MMLARRTFLQLAMGVAAPALVPALARAEGYPTKPVRLVVTVPPGGSPDIVGRLMAQWLSDRLGQPFAVNNKPGGSGNIGAEAIVKAAPDGYSLLLAISSTAINATLYDNLRYDFIRDTAPVSSIGTIPLTMVVHPSVPAKTVPEFIAYAKANPGTMQMASSGIGTPLHVAGELFKMMAGVDMFHIPYRAEGPALTDMVGGQVQVMFAVLAGALPHVKDGKLRALAVTAPKRHPLLPDVPAMAEFLPGYEAGGWYGVVAPKGTPADVVETLNTEINAALADATVSGRLAELGCSVAGGPPAAFGKFIADETAKWGKVIKFAGVKPE